MENNKKITLDAKECSEYIGISYWTLLSMCRQKQIPHVKVGRQFFFRQETIDSWMNDKEKESIKIEEPIKYSRAKYV